MCHFSESFIEKVKQLRGKESKFSNLNHREERSKFAVFSKVLSKSAIYVFYRDYHVWMKIVLQIKFHWDFPTLANLPLLLITPEKMLT